MKLNVTWLAPLAFALIGGCSPSIDPSSPRGVAERVIDAMNDADLNAFLRALPPRDALARYLTCAPSHSLSDALRRAQEEAPATLPLWRQSGVQRTITRFDERNAESEILSTGDTLRNCTVTESMEVKRVNVTLLSKRGGQSEENTELWPFWRFGDDPRWYYTRF